MIEAIERIRDFTSGGRAEFFNDPRTHEAVAYEALKLGEAASRVSEGFRAAHPKVPWRRLIRLRHEIVHEYFRVELDDLWNFVDSEIADVERKIRPLTARTE